MSVSLSVPVMDFQTGADYSGAAKYLSKFQIEKLAYFFHSFFDHNSDGVIDAADFDGLNERLRKAAGWHMMQDEYKLMIDTNRVFFECLLDQVEKEQVDEDLEHRTWEEALQPVKFEVTSINFSQWLNMWGRLCKNAAGIDQMPIWVQILPNLIFKVISSQDNNTEEISMKALKNFYKEFTGLTGSELDATVNEGFRTMTANGDYILDLTNFKLLFSNFLLGKTIYGPGKYIFGCFDNSDMYKKYEVLYS
jgi:hypothetical protein